MMLLRAWITKKKIGLNQGQFHTIPGNIQICIILYLYQTCIWDRLAPPSSTFLKLLLSHKSESCITFLLMTSVEFGIKNKIKWRWSLHPLFWDGPILWSCDVIARDTWYWLQTTWEDFIHSYANWAQIGANQQVWFKR